MPAETPTGPVGPSPGRRREGPLGPKRCYLVEFLSGDDRVRAFREAQVRSSAEKVVGDHAQGVARHALVGEVDEVTPPLFRERSGALPCQGIGSLEELL